MRVAISGYFDPLHKGHIEYIQQAKALEANVHLILILNNDQQALKKKGYVFLPIHHRLAVVQALKWVDEVFVSIDNDLTVCKSLEALRPDIFAKGGDRFGVEIPEGKTCRDLDIRIVDGLGEKIGSSSFLVEKAIDNIQDLRQQFYLFN